MNVQWLQKALEKVKSMCGSPHEIDVVVQLNGTEYGTEGVDLTGYTPGDEKPLRLKIMVNPRAQSECDPQALHQAQDRLLVNTSKENES